MPIKLIYEDKNESVEVDVYHFHQTDNEEVFVTCWNAKDKIWITAPLAYFHPVTKKKLNEKT